MLYSKTITLKDGRQCLLRQADADDASDYYDIFQQTHTETDYLLSYPEENDKSLDDMRAFLASSADSNDEIELIATVGGKVVACAGIGKVGGKDKVRHRAEFGVSVLKDYWGLGVGRALTAACIECAKATGYAQLELDVVEDNENAIALYRKMGFVEYGRNPRGFLSKLTGWQALVLMRLEL